MNFFGTSTQNRNWLKNELELHKLQEKKTKAIINRIIKLNEKTKKEIEEIQTKNPGSKTPDDLEQKMIHTSKIKFLKEEKHLILHFTKKILNLLNKKINSRSLKTYALTYYRRFFLKKSCLDYNPEFMLFACIFLGGKVAQVNLNLNKMDELIPMLKEEGNHSNLLYYEFYLSTILGYDFYVFNPYKALIGFIYQLEKKNYFDNLNINKSDFENECENFIDNSFLTDIIFLYSYSYISLSSIYLTVEKFNLDINIIIQLLNLNSSILDKFNDIYIKIKDELNSININEEEVKNVMKGIKHFSKKYPHYIQQLEQERNKLLTKMNDFSINLNNLEYPNNNNINNNHINNNNNNRINTERNGEIINNNINNNNIYENNLEYLQNKRERTSPIINNPPQ